METKSKWLKTVGQLIEELKKLPPETKLEFDQADGCGANRARIRVIDRGRKKGVVIIDTE